MYINKRNLRHDVRILILIFLIIIGAISFALLMCYLVKHQIIGWIVASLCFISATIMMCYQRYFSR